jgi:hypothetical protein
VVGVDASSLAPDEDVGPSSTSAVRDRTIALATSVRVNAPENARLAFDHVVTDRLPDMVETNFKFYKRITDDRDFAKFCLDWLFDRFRAKITGARREGEAGRQDPAAC